MPFANQHAARQQDPKGFTRFRRGKLAGAPAGVSVVFGVRSDGKSEIQSVRFDNKKFTPAKAKAWLKDHNFKTGGFEQATGKERWSATVKIEKIDEEKKIAFGWLYTARDKHALVADPEHIAEDGTVVDHSRETIEIDDLEDAQYAYVKNSRVGRQMHEGDPCATLVESFVSTSEKRAEMGLPDDSLPDGVWVGYALEDDDVWARIKSGELGELSLGGSAIKEEI